MAGEEVLAAPEGGAVCLNEGRLLAWESIWEEEQGSSSALPLQPSRLLVEASRLDCSLGEVCTKPKGPPPAGTTIAPATKGALPKSLPGKSLFLACYPLPLWPKQGGDGGCSLAAAVGTVPLP